MKISNPETVIVPCFKAFAHAQSTYFPIEDRRHCTLQVHQFVKLKDICPSYSVAKLLKIAQNWNGHWTCRNDPSPFLCVSTGKQRLDPSEPSPFYVHCTASISKLNNNPFNQYDTQNTPSKSYRRNRGRPFDSAGEGGGGIWRFLSGQNIYFQSFAGGNIYFHPNSAQTIYFKI